MTIPESTAQMPPSVNPKLTGPKRQHFLPEFYLKGFTKNGMLAVYDRQSNSIRVQQPKNTGVIGHFYTLKDAEGRQRFELEEMLCGFEKKANQVIMKLVAKKPISTDERTDLAIFIALAAFRTPDIVDSLKGFNSELISDIAKRRFANVEEVKDRIRSKTGSPISEEELEKEAQGLVNFINSGAYKVTTDHKWAVGKAMEMAFTVAPILARRDWIVTHRNNDKKSFVTTDAPVLLTTVAPRKSNFYGVGFGNSDALVVFPLTASCALLMYSNNGRLEHRVASAQQVRQINLGLTDHCQRFVIGRDEELVRSLANYHGLANKTWQPKMQKSD
ncbi:DUF4238 domain-containing protein [Methylobacter svalbardensis]|uniref:DUF4238 domain-containing protein n=1 Tax=Methylobacter svalbardensis TaxID=3080016 RepID=UPI0030EE2B85